MGKAPRRAALALVVLVTAGTVACGGDEAEPATSSKANGTSDPAQGPAADYAGLCTTLEAATRGDLQVAQQSFDHGPLHGLADAAIAVDRGLAARLLQAKEAVESGLADATAADRVAEGVRTLIQATDAALAATRSGPPTSCEKEGS